MQSLLHISTELSLSPREVLWADIKSLLKLAAPIIGITLSRMLMGFSDFVIVSFMGTDATAAISPSSFFVFTGICLAMGAVTSVQTFTAQAMGRGDRHEAAGYVWQGLYLALASCVLAYGCSQWTDFVWHSTGAPPEVVALEIAYCRICFWSVPFAAACCALECFFNGIQKPSVALKAIIIALIFNIVGNYILVFGKFGFPAMGIRGSAIATVMAWGIRALILAIVFFSHEFRKDYSTASAWRFDKKKFRGIVALGGPTSIQWLLDIGAWFIFLAVIIQGFGKETLAASNIGIQYMHVAFMPAIGVGIALCSVVGHAIGEGRIDLAIRKTRAALLVSMVYMGAIGVVFLLIPRFLISFVSNDPEVIRVAITVLVWAALFQVSDAVCIIYIYALRGAGDTRWPAIALVSLVWGVFLFGGYGFARFYPELRHHGPWMMCTLYITILAVVLWRRFVGGKWRKIDLFRKRPGESEALPQVALETQPVAAPLSATAEVV
ncbi:MAG TPA: MATE family efflux transporter [Phycisphaerae bacterium]|nr:MATE family efflux transporter [Phycisphaerae bacterium]